MRDFRELKVWQKSHALTRAVYKATTVFPKEEIYGLTSQLRRASVSIPANVAEGCCRKGKDDFARFLQIAAGSASELEYLLLLSYEIELLKEAQYELLSSQVTEVKRMLTSFMQKLRAGEVPASDFKTDN
ncbi:MAG: four helix bundle protein [Nitrospiraceae bacterium]|nr:four helix bundle protein [Nitrospiraceae bacterium]